VVLGADYTMPASLGTAGPPAGDSSPKPAPPPGTQPNEGDPESISGAGVQCVK
jgi:hypothetical protein